MNVLLKMNFSPDDSMICCRFKRFRAVDLLLLAFVSTWIFVTYYLAFYKTSIIPRLPGEDHDSIDDLEIKINRVEQVVRNQLKENEKLLRNIQRRDEMVDDGKSIVTVVPRAVDVDYSKVRIAVLVIACNRPAALQNVVDQLLKLRSSVEQFPVIISQDCFHEETSNVIKSYGSQIMHIQHPDKTLITLPPKETKFLGYYKLARHYRWALNKTFYDFGHDSVIIVEDDLDLAVDFFDFFLAGNKLLKQDPSLWCVSAWNDHGKAELIDSTKPELLYRTDFFGGLGWLLQKSLWDELHAKWPIRFWDDWMRHPDQRKNRACIRPEISRTAMSSHGKVGVSKGLYFDKHLKFIKLNDQYVNFSRLDTSYLLKDNYDEPFVKLVYSTQLVDDWDALRTLTADDKKPHPKALRLTYTDQNSFKALAKSAKIMEDAKAGVPRMAYRGIVTFIYKQTRVYLTPLPGWTQYDVSWT